MKEQQEVDNEQNVPKQIMQHFTGLLLEGKLDEWAELFTTDAIFEFPYSPPGYPQRLEGKSAIFNHVNALFKFLKIHQFSEPTILIDSDQQRFVAEFTCEGVFLSTGSHTIKHIFLSSAMMVTKLRITETIGILLS